MANYAADKFISTSQDTYRNPRDQFSYKYYHPQVFTSAKNDYQPNKGTKPWFQDYRRSNIAENTLRENIATLNTPVRPTNFSDKPDIALGARKSDREALFPIIHNNPVYLLTNRNPDRECGRDKSFMKDVYDHRDQYKDLTGSKHKKVDRFYSPFPAKETFSPRNVSSVYITDFPGHHTAAMEFVYNKDREQSAVNFKEKDICA